MERIKITAKKATVLTSQPESPSRYSIMSNDANTSAEPVSCCIKINATGRSIRNPICTKLDSRVNLKL